MLLSLIVLVCVGKVNAEMMELFVLLSSEGATFYFSSDGVFSPLQSLSRRCIFIF